MTEPTSVVTLRVDLKVRDYDMWRQAFEGDAGGRVENGARRYRIFRPIEAANEVSIDLDFDSADRAEAFLEIMRTSVWPDPDKAPAKIGAAHTRIVELVETHEY
jgi:hypothetical protein